MFEMLSNESKILRETAGLACRALPIGLFKFQIMERKNPTENATLESIAKTFLAFGLF